MTGWQGGCVEVTQKSECHPRRFPGEGLEGLNLTMSLRENKLYIAISYHTFSLWADASEGLQPFETFAGKSSGDDPPGPPRPERHPKRGLLS